MTYEKFKFLLVLILCFSCQGKPVCEINYKNANSKVYDEEEAVCFIALKLADKTLKLEQIQTALLIEFDYMKKIGLVLENQSQEKESSTELDINEVIAVAMKNEKIKISKEKLINIYNAETSYLEFIGVIN